MNPTSPDYQCVYEGNLRTRMTHERSKSEVITDAPIDNQGNGEAFSPTRNRIGAAHSRSYGSTENNP